MGRRYWTIRTGVGVWSIRRVGTREQIGCRVSRGDRGLLHYGSYGVEMMNAAMLGGSTFAEHWNTCGSRSTLEQVTNEGGNPIGLPCMMLVSWSMSVSRCSWKNQVERTRSRTDGYSGSTSGKQKRSNKSAERADAAAIIAQMKINKRRREEAKRHARSQQQQDQRDAFDAD